MYENFFGFKEKPFKLVPNPDYLFLSKSHEEALAHLNYALSQGDGFVEITGEVGTGKTTLCRAFLENLDDDTIAAYIFNPTLGPKQLIKTICDELAIKCEPDNTKEIIDSLNNFLMRQKTLRKKVILLIDEAQNLNKNVLEQLRLLSNLETNKEKLLQIILVGQPELSDILDSHELRQLGQRITLRYRLSPLTSRETVDYIQYRINKASQKSGIKFDRPAFRLIYRYSRGIPRVINIACDRVLLTAFGLSKHKITGGIARDAINELKSRGAARRYPHVDWRKVFIIGATAGVVLVAAVFHQPLIHGIGSFFKSTPAQNLTASIPEVPEPPPGADSVSSVSENRDLSPDPDTASMAALDSDLSAAQDSEPDDFAQAASKESPARQEVRDDEVIPSEKDAIRLPDFLTAMDIRSSRFNALKYAMELWQTPIEDQPYLNSLDDDQAFFRLATKPKGFSIHRIETDLDLLKRLNLPAILEFYPTGSEEPGYLTLSQIEGDLFVFGSPTSNEPVVSDSDEVNLYWSGIAYVPWKNYLSIWGIIPRHSNKDSIITLKLLLHELGFGDVALNDEYDDPTRRAIEEIQAKYGMPVDGFVGPLTKIILYQEKNSFEMPHLTR
ncbi:MAG: AAA family ATPase [Desulfobacterales bacterium]|nr:MAG: AAA family ATPase [Desulfobacterales bacterium]